MSNSIRQGIPQLSTPLLNPDGTMSLPWYRFFLSLYDITGLKYISPGQQANSDYWSSIILYNPNAGLHGWLHVLRSQDGSFLNGGTVVLGPP